MKNSLFNYWPPVIMNNPWKFQIDTFNGVRVIFAFKSCSFGSGGQIAMKIWENMVENMYFKYTSQFLLSIIASRKSVITL